MYSNRRQFIKTLIAGGVAASLPFNLKGAFAPDQTLTILHTNDVHSHLDPFDANHPKYPNLGGFARRATLINQLRQKFSHVLLVDAGDIFQGTPYFNFFGGKPELQLMSKMHYDAATIGNHEFDNGMEHLAKQLRYADFPFICTNYDFKNTVMQGKTIPWKIINKGLFKVGIIGVGINPDGLISPANYKGMKWLNPVTISERTAKFLKEEKGCNMVIALSHLGLKPTAERKDSDQKLATETASIDLIIGGHSHTFMEKPQLIKNKIGKTVAVNQVGWGGVILGQINYTLKEGESQLATVQHIIK